MFDFKLEWYRQMEDIVWEKQDDEEDDKNKKQLIVTGRRHVQSNNCDVIVTHRVTTD